MIIAKGNTFLSIRDVKFDGAVNLEGKKRGENIISVHYQILTKILDKEENSDLASWRYVVLRDNTVTFNGEFGDEHMKEMIYSVKNFAVKLLKEMNVDELRDIDAALGRIEQQNPEGSK